MCGFTGFYSETISKRENIVREMSNKIIHRGPDSEGYYTDDYVAFGFRRLSFVDIEKDVSLYIARIIQRSLCLMGKFTTIMT